MDNSALKKRINGRIVGILSHGKSIEELENRIIELKDYNICWASFNYYNIFDRFILNKINKHLDIVLECAAGRTKEFELNIRIPRILVYGIIETMIISTWRLMRTQYEQMDLLNFYETFKDNILLADDLLGELNIPNSLALLICCITMGEPKKIILFGVDGYKREMGDEFNTYYKGSLQKEYREKLLGKLEYTLHETSNDFENTFLNILESYCKKGNVKVPEIINCSPDSIFTIFRKVSYSELLNELK